MSPPRKKRRRRAAKRGMLRYWWPLLLALVLTPVALRGASILALSGPHALVLLFPFPALTQLHWTRAYAGTQQDALTDWAMWAQFPLYGLLASLLAYAGRMGRALLAVLVVHALAVGAALLLHPAA